MRFLAFSTALIAGIPAWAGEFDRPIPKAQFATGEFWFAAARWH